MWDQAHKDLLHSLLQLWTISEDWSQKQNAQIWIERAGMQRTDYSPCRHWPGLEQMHLPHIVTSSATTPSHGSITKLQVWAWWVKVEDKRLPAAAVEVSFWHGPHPFTDTILWSYVGISNMRSWISFTHRWFSMSPSQFSGICSALQVQAYIDITSAVHFDTNDDVNCPT